MGVVEIQSESSGGPGDGVQKGFVATLKKWWCTRVQGDLAVLFGTLAVFDATPYADDLNDFFKWPHWKSALRLAGAAAIFWRARQARKDAA